MNASPFLNWLLRASWQAAILVVLVLAAQWLARRRVNARWRYALWLLVLVRLAMPSMPASSWSIYNAVHDAAAATAPPRMAANVARPASSISVTGLAEETPPIPENMERGRLEPQAIAAPMVFDKPRLMRNAAIVWLVGLLVLGGHAIGQNIVFSRRLRHAKAVTDSETLALFHRCKDVMGVLEQVPLAHTEYVKSPALYGFFHPTLLLPVNVMARFTLAEQRHIFLHELAHVKRRDMAVHWVATMFRLMHWFNPVLWFGFQRMAADRELACDELALSCAGEAESRPYGETVLKLLEICARPTVWPGLMGILEEKSQMTRRILMIARYKQQAHWPILALLLLIGLGLVTLTDAQTENTKPVPAVATITARPDLIGQVRMTNGQPVRATVFIATAGPKTGTSTFCPSCYTDCAKSAKTDAQGRFKIESLDPALIFRILVVAKDCAPKYVTQVDPAKGPVKVELESRNYADAPPGNTLVGRVIDSQGAPIIGAVVEAHGIRTKNGGGTWGELPGVDPLAVTDDQGEFLITSLKPFDAMDVKVEALGFARKTFTDLSSGKTPHDLPMAEGAAVSGRVVWNGKPLAGVSVGIVSTDRTAENFTGDYEVGTDMNGRFIFFNLPPNVQYYLYGIMDTLQQYGAVTPTHIASGGDGSKVEAGDLLVEPAHRLSGQVVLDDGKPVPAKTRLLIGRDDAWDTQQIELDKDGHFAAGGIPSGAVSLSVRVPNYHYSARNASLGPFAGRLMGRVDADVTNLLILLEKGPAPEPDYDNLSGDDLPQNRALRGAEGPNDHSGQIAITGRVTDAETKQPVPQFTITPGQSRPFMGTVNWRSRESVNGSHGSFTVFLPATTFDPLLKAEADGYLPSVSPALLPNQTNYDFVLTRGTGPSGTVVLPNGQPAQGVSVLLVCAGQMDVGLDEDGRLTAFRNRNLKEMTDASGRFSFPPELQMESVIASGPNGFTWVSLESLAGHSNTVVLNPWGKIKGRLLRPGGPGKGEKLDTKAIPPPNTPEHPFFLGGAAVTDSDGNFEMDRVPAGESEISYRVVEQPNNPNSGWQNEALQLVTVKPGETLELTVKAPERISNQGQGWGRLQTEAAKPARTGPPLNGAVVLPDGTPVVGAEVVCVAPQSYFPLRHYTFGGNPDRIVRTVSGGKFALPTVDGTTDICAANEKGFAKVSLESVRASGKMVLEPWGRIEGTLHIGRRLGTNEVVGLEGGNWTTYIAAQDYQVRTDSEGHFAIPDVPSGPHTVARLISLREGSWGPTQETDIVVKSGEVTRMEIGGTGRPVIGKAVLDEPGKQVDWRSADCFLRSKAPPAPKFKTVREQQAWWTEGGRKWHFYRARASADGSFRIEDVPPGTYDLIISISQRNPGRRPPFRKNIASVQMEVTVAEAPTPGDDSPADLGTITVKVHHPLNIGDLAAPIEAQTLDGQPLRLSDYRGRNVLLIIGTSSAGDGESSELKEIASSFAGDKRLAMINLCLNPDLDLAKDAFKTSDLHCIRGCLTAEKANSNFFEKYSDSAGIQIPFVVVIDSAGRIVGNGLHGLEIRDTLSKALAKK